MNKILIIGFVCVCQCLFAQVPDSIRDLPAEQVEVIKQFEARLEDARKVNTIPEPPAQRVLEKFDYSVSIKPLELSYLEPSIKPIGITAPALPETYNGFLDISAGNLSTIDGEVGYNFISKNETEINFTGNTFNQQNKKERFQNYNHVNADLDVNHNFNELVSFGIGGGYHERNVWFYGSPLEEIAEDTSIYERLISDFDFGFKIYNAEENEYDIDYSLALNYQNLRLRNENLLENHFLVGLGLKKDLNSAFSLKLDGTADVSSILDTATLTYNNYHIKPGMSYHSGNLGLDASLDFAFGPENENYYLPDLQLSYGFLENRVIPFLFWKGELQKNNLIPVVQYNPFISASIVSDLKNSVVSRYGGGVRGKVKGLQYNATVAYGSTADLLMFRNNINEQDLRQFTIEQDTANVFEVNVELEYNISENLSVNSNFRYMDYSIIAWHLPTYIFDFQADYKLLDGKLNLNPSLFMRDGISVVTDERIADELPYMLDLNFHAGFKFSNQFKIYAEVNNLLGSEYQQWYDYSNFGLNAKVGAMIKF